ncbi:MAG: 5-formyltetrahydrofolate cyclo-ligase [Eudoraea sp.]|nr:5-formyltetrahydrofolate cyclo-ligase [Eudoraea sp.]
MLKKELRLNFTSLRKELSKEQQEIGSLAIARHVNQLPIWQYQYFHLFLQIPERKEIDTSYILTILQAKDKHVIVPKISGPSKLKNYLLTDSTVFKKNQWNIPEPVEGISVPSNKIEVVFVPLLAFDLKGNRVGYGKGFYDNFLSECSSDVIKIGLSFFEAVEVITDVHKSDVALNYCVTPENIYSF